MHAPAAAETSTLGLVRSLTNDTKRLLRQEIELAKAEVSEKVSFFSRNAVAVAIGGFIAYAGLIVFLVGVGWLVGWAFQKAGVQPVLAEFLGLVTIGLLVAAAGGVLVLKGMKTFSKNSLAPQRTIHTLQRLKGNEEASTTAQNPKAAAKRPSEELQAQVEETENRVSETLDTLGHRLSPRHINQRVKHRIQERPYQSGLLAVAAGLVSGLYLTRGSRHS